MTQDPKRWLDGGTDDASLRAWMQLGSEELAPSDCLARVASGLSATPPAPVLREPPLGESALGQHARVGIGLKWFAVLLIFVAASYVALRPHAAQDAASAPTNKSPASPRRSSPMANAPRSSATQQTLAQAPARPASPTEPSAEARSIPGPSARKRPEPRRITPRSERLAGVQGGAASVPNAEVAAASAAAPTVAAPSTRGEPSAAAETPARSTAESSPAPSHYVHRSNIRATEAEQAGGTQREELAQLEAAQRTLRDDPAAALASMQRHAGKYPQSWLAEERDALIIRAQLALHDVERARSGLVRFATRYPESPQLRQLERALAEGASRRLPHVDRVD